MKARRMIFSGLCVLAAGPLLAAELTVKVLEKATGEPVEGAVVTVSGSSAAEPVTAEIVQKNRAFKPHVLVIATGSQVNFPNLDNTLHHVYSLSPAKTFNIELYSGKPSEPVTFDQAGVVEIGCNIHDQMQAFIIVSDAPTRGQTDASGTVTLSVSGGTQPEHELQVWHPRLENNADMESHVLSQPTAATVTIELALQPPARTGNGLDALQQRFNEL